jgi:hypothetical protein
VGDLKLECIGGFIGIRSNDTAFQPVLEKMTELTKKFGGVVNFEVFSGQDFPDCTVADAVKAGFAVEVAKIA